MPQSEKSNRSARLRRVCRLMMFLCLAVAAGRLVTGAAPLADPALATAQVECIFWECRLNRDPVRLLDEDVTGEPVAAAGRARLASVLREPRARLLIFAGAAVRAVPAFFLFLSLGFAFRALGAGAGFARTAAWLRRAAAAAAAAVVAEPIGLTLRASALSPVTSGREEIHLFFDGGPFLWGVLLAGAAWTAVWALEQASAAEQELSKMV